MSNKSNYKEALSEVLDDMRKDQMMYLNTHPAPKNICAEDLDKYINLSDTLLSIDACKEFTLPFGKVINIRRAIDYAIYTSLHADSLMDPSLSPNKIKKLGGRRKSIPNYWAYIAYVLIERITQSDELKEIINSNKRIIDVTMKTVKTAFGDKVVVAPNRDNCMYLGVVREVVKVIRNNVDSTDEVKQEAYNKLLCDMKKKKSADVMANVGVSIELV